MNKCMFYKINKIFLFSIQNNTQYRQNNTKLQLREHTWIMYSLLKQKIIITHNYIGKYLILIFN